MHRIVLKHTLQTPGNKGQGFVLERDKGFTGLETRRLVIQSFKICLLSIYYVSVPGDIAGGFGDWCWLIRRQQNTKTVSNALSLLRLQGFGFWFQE